MSESHKIKQCIMTYHTIIFYRDNLAESEFNYKNNCKTSNFKNNEYECAMR